MVEGVWHEESGPEHGHRINQVAMLLLDLDDEDVVYGPAYLLGYDPTTRRQCSVPDEAIQTSLNTWKYLLQT